MKTLNSISISFIFLFLFGLWFLVHPVFMLLFWESISLKKYFDASGKILREAIKNAEKNSI